MEHVEFEHNTDTTIEALERKAHAPAGEVSPMTEFLSVVADFKAENDKRLAELERRGSVDPLIEEKLRRIESRLDGLGRELVDNRRPALEVRDDTPDGNEIRSAFEAFVRKGRTEDLESLSAKGLSVGSEADGGFLVSPTIVRDLTRRLTIDSPMRSIAKVMTISTSMFKRPLVKSGAASGWVAETGSRPETSAPQLAELAITPMELYAMPAITKQLLDDAHFDVESWLAEELNTSFSENESSAFINGNGVTSPKGILTHARQKSNNPEVGKIGYGVTGAAGALDPEAPADAIVDIVHSLPQRYRKNSVFLMNRMTLSAVRRIKDADGDYIVQQKLTDQLETRLLGFPVLECDDMPEIAVGSASIAFGDFGRGYLVVDRQGVQILRDPYSAKPYVLFYATKRVGGGVSDAAALRLLTFSA